MCEGCSEWQIFGDLAILTLKPIAGPDGTAGYEVTGVKCESCAKRSKEEKRADSV